MTTRTTNNEKNLGRYHCELDRAADDYRSKVDRDRNLSLICSQCRPDLERFFARKLDRSDADDLVQETLATVTETLDQFRGDACVRTWILKIAQNKLYRWWGQRHKSAGAELEPDDSSEELEEPGWTPEEAAEHHELSTLLHQALLDLPPRMRACLMLKVYQDRSYKEIAAILGIRIGTVGATLKNAIARLKKTLGKHINVIERDFEDED